MSEIAISFAVLVAVVLLFVWNKLPVELVAVGAALALYATGVLTLNQALAGFGDSAVIFIATLFVVSEALDSTGVTAWVGQQLIARAGGSRTRLLVLTMVVVALLTALINPNGSVAALVPVVVVMAVRLGRPPSQLLMPAAFAAHAGSMLALTGTPVSVVVSEAAAEAGARPFGFFEFALVGVPLLLGTIAIVVLFGERLLPHRTPRQLPPDFGAHFKVLTEQYGLDQRTHRLAVGPRSPLIGRSPDDLDLQPYPSLALAGVQVQGQGGLVKDAVFAAADVLLLRGEPAAVERLAVAAGLGPAPGPADGTDDRDGLFTRRFGVAEVVVRPRSGLVGSLAFPGMVTESGELVILAVQRGGESLGPGESTLAAGDALLVEGTWESLEEQLDDPDVLVVDAPELVRRQAVPLGPGSRPTIAVLAAMVGLLATGVVPAVVAGLLAAGALILLGVLTVGQAYRAVSWTTVILVAGMIPLSTAMQETGAAALVAEGLVGAVGGAGPHALLFGLVLLTVLFGQMISNMATAFIVIPIAVSVAAETGTSVLPLLMAVNVAAAASFLTPVATPANLMVMGPGGYRFGDYWKLGLPLALLFILVATLLVPLIWPF
jgi:di/tricarboxylate transporter